MVMRQTTSLVTVRNAIADLGLIAYLVVFVVVVIKVNLEKKKRSFRMDAGASRCFVNLLVSCP